MNAGVIHVVRLEASEIGLGPCVYGHPRGACTRGCEDHDTFWYVNVEGESVEAGHFYEVDQHGAVVKESRRPAWKRSRSRSSQ